ncbi:MAG: tripartite tricarboxylate transporter substrate binding protein [Burkholderiales bacterium]|nr:tripartite tricarboxylate transporter substrate binding protein [Burkholderiales bacterium]
MNHKNSRSAPERARRALLRLAASGAMLLAPLAALAQAQAAWPDKPVKWVLSQPPGSGPDNVARLLSDPLGKSLGQPIVIDNKPGGQNVIGAQTAARSAPDGATFYFATTAALVTNSFLFKTLPYDPQKDFVPVAFIGKSPFAVLVKAESPIASMQDLIAKSKADPGKLSLANEGPRTFGGIIARLINARAQARANLVAYSSVGVAVQDVLGGHSDAVVADLASTAQLVRQGRMRLLAVTTAQRIPAWQQVPALAELLPGFDMSGWFAVVAPTGTPQAAITRLHREINTLLADPAIADRILTIGPIAEPLPSPEAVGAFLAGERRRWADAANEIGLLPE